MSMITLLYKTIALNTEHTVISCQPTAELLEEQDSSIIDFSRLSYHFLNKKKDIYNKHIALLWKTCRKMSSWQLNMFKELIRFDKDRQQLLYPDMEDLTLIPLNERVFSYYPDVVPAISNKELALFLMDALSYVEPVDENGAEKPYTHIERVLCCDCPIAYTENEILGLWATHSGDDDIKFWITYLYKDTKPEEELFSRIQDFLLD